MAVRLLAALQNWPDICSSSVKNEAQAIFLAGPVSMKARMKIRKSSASHRRSKPKL